jgi:poly(beta-D-mannuronate) lyase
MDNLFLGNGKAGTGGVRIINEGNWVLNNFFYRCRGEGFRAPLCIMNGVPNSPAFRYLPVKDALVANNSFVDCAPLGFCEGSDTERSQAPVNVLMVNNLIHNQFTI